VKPIHAASMSNKSAIVTAVTVSVTLELEFHALRRGRRVVGRMRRTAQRHQNPVHSARSFVGLDTRLIGFEETFASRRILDWVA